LKITVKTEEVFKLRLRVTIYNIINFKNSNLRVKQEYRNADTKEGIIFIYYYI